MSKLVFRVYTKPCMHSLLIVYPPTAFLKTASCCIYKCKAKAMYQQHSEMTAQAHQKQTDAKWKNVRWSEKSSCHFVVKKKSTVQTVISASVKSQHLWWYGWSAVYDNGEPGLKKDDVAQW